MGLGDVVSVEDFGSPTKLNAKLNLFTDALTLSNLAYTPCLRVIPTTTGYGFTKDVALRRNSDNDAWIIDGLSAHTHSSESNQDGGAFNDVLMDNMGQTIDVDLMYGNKNDYTVTVNGTGAQVSDLIAQTAANYILMEAGTDNGGWAKMNKWGITPDFGRKSKYQIGFEITVDTNMLFRNGIGCEGVDVSNNSSRKYGIEGCSAAPEGLFILVFSADNVTRSTQASVNPIVESSGDSYVVQHSPSVNIKLIKGDYENITTKSNNIPSTSSITGISGDDFGVIKNGIKSTTSGTNKIMRIWGQRFVAYGGSTRWDQVWWDP
jgi:hypothetical protein